MRTRILRIDILSVMIGACIVLIIWVVKVDRHLGDSDGREYPDLKVFFDRSKYTPNMTPISGIVVLDVKGQGTLMFLLQPRRKGLNPFCAGSIERTEQNS